MFESRNSRTPRWLLLAGILTLALYCVNAVHYGNLPLRIEESEWPPMAKAVYETGEPITPAAEMRRIRFDEDLTVDESPVVGAWHPPLYIYTIGIAMAFFGTDSPHALRAVGAVGLLLTALLLIMIAREVTPRWRLIGGVSAILLLIHPYAIQASLFLDIDNTVYAPPALLLLWLAIRFGKRAGPLSGSQILAIGSAIALLAWTKMTTTVVLLGVLLVWWLLSRRQMGRSLFEFVAFTAIGGALFASTYGAWCAVTGIPFSYTFEVTFVGKSNRLLSEWWLVENAAHWHLRWFGAAVFLLTVVYLFDLIRHLYKQHELRSLDLLFLAGVGILVQYVVLSPTDGTYQGKYAFPAVAMLMLPITWLLLREERDRGRLLHWAAALAIGLIAALLIPDVLTNLSLNGNYGTWKFELRIVAAVAATLLITWMLTGRKGFAGGVILVLAVLLCAQMAHSYRADTSPLYPIADTTDFEAATADLNSSMPANGVALVPKDMGFYVERRVIEGEDALARGDARLAAAIHRYPEIVAYAHDSFGPPIGPETEAILQRCFSGQREFGTVVVLSRTPGCR